MRGGAGQAGDRNLVKWVIETLVLLVMTLPIESTVYGQDGLLIV